MDSQHDMDWQHGLTSFVDGHTGVVSEISAVSRRDGETKIPLNSSWTIKLSKQNKLLYKKLILFCA